METKTNSLKILLCFPLILLASNAMAMEIEQCDKMEVEKTSSKKLQEIIKKILVTELCISEELSSQIEEAKLPCKGCFRYLNKPKEILYSGSLPMPGIIVGATLEELKNMDNDHCTSEKNIEIENHGKFLLSRQAKPLGDTIKITETKNGENLNKFYRISSHKVIGKDKKFLKLTYEEHGEETKFFVDTETGSSSLNLEDLL